MQRVTWFGAVCATAIIGILALWPRAHATPNPGAKTIPYQGFIEIDSGPVTDSLPIVFELTDGTRSWKECHPAVTASAGRFAVVLGNFPATCVPCTAAACSDGSGVPAWAFTSSQLDLKISVPSPGPGAQQLVGTQRLRTGPVTLRAGRPVRADPATIVPSSGAASPRSSAAMAKPATYMREATVTISPGADGDIFIACADADDLPLSGGCTAEVGLMTSWGNYPERWSSATTPAEWHCRMRNGDGKARSMGARIVCLTVP